MSVKSEKLQELVSGILSDPNSQVAQRADYVVADMLLPVLIERVETRCRAEDRDRARKTYCVMCRSEGGCPDTYTMTGSKMMNCDYINEFLKNYDNE